MPAKNVGVNSTFEQQRVVINEIAADIDALRGDVGLAGTVITITDQSLVGIGTTNPTSKLHVIGDIKVGIDTSNGIILTSPNGTQYRLIVDNSGVLSTVSI